MLKRNIVLALVVFLFLINFSSAISFLGSFKQSQPIYLIQTCDNGTAMCDNCNITAVLNPNSTILISNVTMEKNIGYFNYTLDERYSFYLGTYNVNGVCSAGATITNWGYTFVVSPSGQELTTGVSLQYILFMFLSVCAFVVLLLGAIFIKGGNQRNNEGFLTSINYKKYGKIACGLGAYIMLMLICYFAYQTTYALTNLQFVYNLTRVAFLTMAWLLLPIFILTLVISAISWVKDARFSEMLTRGFAVR